MDNNIHVATTRKNKDGCSGFWWENVLQASWVEETFRKITLELEVALGKRAARWMQLSQDRVQWPALVSKKPDNCIRNHHQVVCIIFTLDTEPFVHILRPIPPTQFPTRRTAAALPRGLNGLSVKLAISYMSPSLNPWICYLQAPTMLLQGVISLECVDLHQHALCIHSWLD